MGDRAGAGCSDCAVIDALQPATPALLPGPVPAPERMPSLFGIDGPVAVIPLTRGQANDCLTRWEHVLGPCDRPFEQNQHGLVVAGEIIAVTVTGGIVSPNLTDELGRTWGPH